METQQTQTTDSPDEVAEVVESPEPTVEEAQADNELESLLAEEGTEDVAGKSEVEKLSLEELNIKAGRKGENAFKSKEDFFKHYDNLKSFVGKKKPEKSSETESEVAVLRKELAAEKFYSNNPTAKTYEKILEAYAEKNSISISEAWESDDFRPFAESSPKKTITTNNRLNPATPKVPLDLIESAKRGSDQAQLDVVDKWFAGKK